MSQIMIDSKACTKGELIEAARYLLALARMKDEPDFVPVMPEIPDGPQHYTAPVAVAADVPAGTPTAADVFGGPKNDAPAVTPANNVLPFVPPPPPPVTVVAPAPVNTVMNTPAVSAPASSSVDLDINRLPWDGRIHAETKAKNKDGSWRNKRGAKPEFIAAVTAELRVNYPVPVGSLAAAAAAIPPSTVVPPPPVGVPPPPSPATAGFVPPPPPGVVAPVLPIPGQEPLTFGTLMAKITGAMNTQRLGKPQLDEALAAHKVVGMPALVTAPTEVLASINTYLARWGV